MAMLNYNKPGTPEYSYQQMINDSERIRKNSEEARDSYVQRISTQRHDSSSEFKLPWVVTLGLWIVTGYFLLKWLGWLG